MGDFLDVAEEVGRSERDPVLKQAFADVFDGYEQLRTLFSKTLVDLDNIESLFALFEMSELLQLPAWSDPEMGKRLPQAIRTVIVRTLERRIQFQVDAPAGPPVQAHPSYQFFCNHCQQLKDGLGGRLDFITFNYDVSLDLALLEAQIPYQYGLSDEENPAETRLLKLHGSLNWVVPDEGQPVAALVIDRLFREERRGGPLQFSVLRGLENRRVFIVPPTWNKTGHHHQIAPVWRAAGEVLGKAENIFVIGYSLPASDYFFRYLFALAADSKTRIRRFWVYDPSAENGVAERFRNMLGPLVENRFRAFAKKFDDVPSSQTREGLLERRGRS